VRWIWTTASLLLISIGVARLVASCPPPSRRAIEAISRPVPRGRESLIGALAGAALCAMAAASATALSPLIALFAPLALLASLAAFEVLALALASSLPVESLALGACLGLAAMAVLEGLSSGRGSAKSLGLIGIGALAAFLLGSSAGESVSLVSTALCTAVLAARLESELQALTLGSLAVVALPLAALGDPRLLALASLVAIPAVLAAASADGEVRIEIPAAVLLAAVSSALLLFYRGLAPVASVPRAEVDWPSAALGALAAVGLELLRLRRPRTPGAAPLVLAFLVPDWRLAALAAAVAALKGACIKALGVEGYRESLPACAYSYAASCLASALA